MHGVRRWIRHLGALLTSHASTGTGLRVAADELFAELEAHRATVAGFFDALAQAGRAPELRAQLAAHYEQFRTELAAMLGTDDATASMLLALTDGLIVQWHLDPTRTPRTDDILPALRTLVRHLEGR